MKQYKHNLTGNIITVTGYTTYLDDGIKRKAVIINNTAMCDYSSFLDRYTLI